MADFNLTQTDAQVQSILNDAQDAMGAGAQTSLTTDYIMLKGTNGRYHKILKDSFTEAVRNVLAGLLVNNDKGTTISQIATIASGDFGSVTPANLASVLGAEVPIVTAENNASINDDVYKQSGVWYFTYAVNDLPYTNTTAGCIVETIRAKQSASRALQRLTVLSSSGAPNIYLRAIWQTGNIWGNWYVITPTSLTQ